ncbi:MAG: hypothetical protein LBV69_11615 [Bacteroidales bacterium]|jgi:hypothetical protein|nr:hypothetical protein [Bacteroidales bacterium]
MKISFKILFFVIMCIFSFSCEKYKDYRDKWCGNYLVNITSDEHVEHGANLKVEKARDRNSPSLFIYSTLGSFYCKVDEEGSITDIETGHFSHGFFIKNKIYLVGEYSSLGGTKK